MNVRVPVDAVLAIYARETGQGLIFSEGEDGPTPEPPPASPADAAGRESPSKPGPGRARLKVVK
jgi:stringent starvation protein B